MRAAERQEEQVSSRGAQHRARPAAQSEACSTEHLGSSGGFLMAQLRSPPSRQVTDRTWAEHRHPAGCLGEPMQAPPVSDRRSCVWDKCVTASASLRPSPSLGDVPSKSGVNKQQGRSRHITTISPIRLRLPLRLSPHPGSTAQVCTPARGPGGCRPVLCFSGSQRKDSQGVSRFFFLFFF